MTPRGIMYLHRSMSFGATQMDTLTVIRSLDPERFAPSICCMRDLGELGEEAQREGIRVFVLSRPGKGSPDPILVWRLARLLSDKKVALLQTHSFHSDAYGGLAALLAGTPVVVRRLGVTPSPKMRNRLINRALARRQDAVVAISQALADLAAKRDGVPGNSLRVIYNGVDVNAFAPATDRAEAKRALGIDPSKQVVLNVARFARVKGQRYLLEALAQMKSRPRCVLLGWGDERENLSKLADSLGVAERVTFAGPARDVVPYLHAADLFVFPSLREGLGKALLEAAACGLPAVASDIAPLREAAGCGPALFVPPGDAAALAGALDDILADSARRDEMGAAARRRAVEAFSLDRMLAEYRALYEELLAAKGVA